jgi:hypothetical protein
VKRRSAQAKERCEQIHRQGESGIARGCGVALGDAAEEGEVLEACLERRRGACG